MREGSETPHNMDTGVEVINIIPLLSGTKLLQSVFSLNVVLNVPTINTSLSESKSNVRTVCPS